VLNYVRIGYNQVGQPWGDLRRYERAADGRGRAIAEGIPSIWHQIEDWFRRVAGFFGLEF